MPSSRRRSPISRASATTWRARRRALRGVPRRQQLASRDDADEDAGAAAALDAIDRQCRLVDQTAAAIQETLGSDVASAAPRLGAARRRRPRRVAAALGARASASSADAFVARRRAPAQGRR